MESKSMFDKEKEKDDKWEILESLRAGERRHIKLPR